MGAVDSTLRTSHEADVGRFCGGQPPHRGWNLGRQPIRERARGRHHAHGAHAWRCSTCRSATATSPVFESKYHYRTWRPETAIARAGEDGNQQDGRGREFPADITSPCFPRLPFRPRGRRRRRTHDPRARVRPQAPRHHHVDSATQTSCCTTPISMDIVDDVTVARVYGGIHFRVDQDVGDRMGAEVARYNDERCCSRSAGFSHPHRTTSSGGTRSSTWAVVAPRVHNRLRHRDAVAPGTRPAVPRINMRSSSSAPYRLRARTRGRAPLDRDRRRRRGGARQDGPGRPAAVAGSSQVMCNAERAFLAGMRSSATRRAGTSSSSAATRISSPTACAAQRQNWRS